MQSTPPEGSGSSSSLGYYLWLAAIGAIVYAYIFATSASEMKNKTPNVMFDENDPSKQTVNTGHRVMLLLPLVWLYTVFTKMFTSVTFQYVGSNFYTLMYGVIIAFILAFASILTQSNGVIADNGEGNGLFWANIGLIIFFAVVSPVVAAIKGGGSMEKFIETGARFIMNFWFPLIIMFVLIKTGATYWFQMVAGASISISILMLCYSLYFNKEPMKDWGGTFKQSLLTTWNGFPFATYLKYVEDNDLNDVAKRVLIFALLCYVAYLVNTVYKFKHRLVPCVSSSISSCFWNPDMKFNGYDPNKTTPYVNALFYTLLISMGANLLNVIIQIFSVYKRINNVLNGATDFIPDPMSKFSPVTLLQMIVFPFYWMFKMVVQHPLAAILAVVAFVALGLFLYRSPFDLTAFIEGQRGTVITLFTMFVAALVVFGIYVATNPAKDGENANKGSSDSGTEEDTSSFGQFIMKPFLLIAVAACIIGLIMFFLNSHSSLITIATLVQYAITLMIYIGAIAVVIGLGRTMFSTSRKMGDSMFQISEDSNWVINVLKLIGNLMFYLPCMLIDGVEMLKEQYGLTTRPILILIALEAAFILAGHFLPSLVTKAINHTGVQILSAPIAMTPQTTINTYQIQFVDSYGVVSYAGSGSNPLPPLTDAPTPTPTLSPMHVQLHNYSYGVSAWVYIHPQPPNLNADYSSEASELNVFNFGGSLGPVITYTPKTNALNVRIAGEKSPSKPIPPIVDFPLQRWNNVVVNSDKGEIDIFINGRLVYTGTHIMEITKTTSTINSVVIGQGDDNKRFGIQGEICNVVLNRDPFTKAELTWIYETNKMLNPPVVGVSDAENGKGEDATNPTSFSTNGAKTYGFIGAFFGAIFGWLFNDANSTESAKGLVMGAVVFGLIGTLLGALFSTDGTVAYILKTAANVFVDTF